jgi:hypothetical protein
MFNQFPYDTLAKKLSGLKMPFTSEKFESVFRDISSETEIVRVQQIDIQNDLCNVFRISPKEVNTIYHPLPPAYLFYKIQAILIMGERRFYMMIHCGNDSIITPHTFNQTISGLRNSQSEFSFISSGRFQNRLTNNLVSAEEDEFNKNYILVTNSEWLMNSDDIFNFSRNFFTI